MIVTDMIHIGDPQILPFEGKYYCYATSRANEGFLVWVSQDLTHWSQPTLCFLGTAFWGADHFWAPEVVYHGGRFIMHYTARSRALGSLRLGVAVSDSPLGPFKDVYDAPLFDCGYAAIDGSVLCCPEGNFLYFSRDCCENYVNGIKTSQVWCVRLDETLTRTEGEAQLMTTPEYDWERLSLTLPNHFGNHLWNEGPCVVYEGGRYYMNFSANCYATNDYAIGLAVSDHPLGPWHKPANNPVLSQRGELFGAGHNAFFRGFDGQLYTSFHIQTDPTHPSGDRRAAIGRVTFGMKDGEPVQEIW